MGKSKRKKHRGDLGEELWDEMDEISELEGKIKREIDGGLDSWDYVEPLALNVDALKSILIQLNSRISELEKDGVELRFRLKKQEEG